MDISVLVPVKEPDGLESSNAPSMAARLRAWSGQFKRSVNFILKDRNVIFLLASFLVSRIGRQAINILIQCVSKRYDWTIAQAGLLLSLCAAVSIILFVAILPALAVYLLRRTGQAAFRDLILARGSGLFLIAGSGILALSFTPGWMITGLIVLTLGMGLSPAARSLITSLVESRATEGGSEVGLLYAIISVVEGIGGLLGAVLLPGSLRIGFRLGGPWLGLPFAVCTGLFAFAVLMILSVKPRSLCGPLC
jgi:MFS family permease